MSQNYKKDAGKPPMNLLSRTALEGTARVLDFGAQKYAANAWRAQAGEWSRMLAAVLRHINAFNDGEDYDPETGECHLHHAACGIMFLQEYFERELGIDDRWVDTRRRNSNSDDSDKDAWPEPPGVPSFPCRNDYDPREYRGTNR